MLRCALRWNKKFICRICLQDDFAVLQQEFHAKDFKEKQRLINGKQLDVHYSLDVWV